MGLVLSGGEVARVQPSTQAALSEAITDVTRQIEDLLWVSISTDTRALGLDEHYEERKRLLQRIRLYRRRHPLAKVAAGLVQHYVLGRGVTLKANNRRKVAKLVDEFWENPINRVVFTGHEAMKGVLDTVYTDGAFWLVLVPDETKGTLTLGQIDAMFVEDVVFDPKNGKVPRWYKVRTNTTRYDYSLDAYVPTGVPGVVYYRDWRNGEDDPANDPPTSKQGDGLLMPITINRRGKFGESELAAGLDWLKAHKEFMEDRVSLNRAASQIAWRRKMKTNAAGIQSEVERLRSTLTQNINRWESNPPNASAGTLAENEGSNTEWMKTDTGAQAASADERVLRMMAGSGMGGIPNHYFGDEANANLATATAMELPLLKTYEDWQQLLGDVIHDVLDFMLQVAYKAGRIGPRDDSARYAERNSTPQAAISLAEKPPEEPSPAPLLEAGGGAGGQEAPIVQISLQPKTEPASQTAAEQDQTGAVDWYIDIDFPPILSKDINAYVVGLKALYEVLPATNLESQKLVATELLRVLGINDVEQVMERLFPADLVSPEVLGGAAKAAGALRSIGGGNLPQTPPSLPPGPPQPPQPLALPAPKEPKEPTPAQTRESEATAIAEMASYRIRRLVLASERAAQAVARAEAAERAAEAGA